MNEPWAFRLSHMRLTLWAVMLVTLAAATGIRFYQIGAEDYWLDEIHTLANAAARRATLMPCLTASCWKVCHATPT